MQVEYITNAALLVTLADGRTLLTDPWLSGGIYYGSWYHYPPVPEDLLARYRSLRPDWIYLSHLHPDHLDPVSLGRFPRDTPIVIGRLPDNHLSRAIAGLGFRRIVQLDLEVPTPVDGVEMTVLGPFSPTTEGYANLVDYVLDTSLHVRDADGVTLLNVNDNPILPPNAHDVVARLGRPDIAILPFSGASSYPHAFPQYSAEEKAQRRRELADRQLDRFVQVAGILEPRWVVPAAGSYVMGSRLAEYSRYLPQAPPAEIAQRWSAERFERAQLRLLATGDVLSDDGCVERQAAAVRDFTEDERLEYARTLGDLPLAQEGIRVPRGFRVPWARLFGKARRNLWASQQRQQVCPPCDVELVLKPSPGLEEGNQPPARFCFALDAPDPYAEGAYERRPGRRRVTFHVDAGLMLMTLLGAAVWDNLEIAALVEVEREPDEYDPTIHSLMSFLML